MALSDDELLDFDMKQLGELERTPRSLLDEHGDAYRQHLLIAKQLWAWADRAEETRGANPRPEYHDGFVEALREVAVRLSQGDYLHIEPADPS